MNNQSFFSIILTIVLVTMSSFNPVYAETVDNVSCLGTTVQCEQGSNSYHKLHMYDYSLNQDGYHNIDNEDELKNVLSMFVKGKELRTTSEGDNEPVKITVEFYSGFSSTDEYQQLVAMRDTINSLEDMRSWRARLRTYSAQYHEKLLSEYEPLLSDFNCSLYNEVRYSPYVIMEMQPDSLTEEQLINLVHRDEVLNVYLEIDNKAENSVNDSINATVEIPAQYDLASYGTTQKSTWNDMLNNIGAYDIVTSGDYTGEGVRVGILEAVGSAIYDVNNPNFADKDITILTPSDEYHSHATAVLSVATLIAPNAEFYFANWSTTGIELFIDEECDVVNLSYGAVTNGYTASMDAIMDYHSYNHFVTIVAAAGNVTNGNVAITSPGYGYNVVTVGGVAQTTTDKLIHYATARYSSSFPKTKPNVSAMNWIMIPNVSSSGGTAGTSIAAPQVTACIALMIEQMNMEQDYYIQMYPESVMAIITSTATKTDDYDMDYGYYDDKVGAGVIDLERMISSNTEVQHYISVDVTVGEDYCPSAFYLTAGQELQLSVSVLANVTYQGSINTIRFTDYDVYVYPLSGSEILASSTFSDEESNVELIRFIAPVSNGYRIVIRAAENCDNDTGRDIIAWSYNIS